MKFVHGVEMPGMVALGVLPTVAPALLPPHTCRVSGALAGCVGAGMDRLELAVARTPEIRRY
ncbi:MAG: hypothetical protein CBARDCOR_2209 [uncultured Caballeronia sp.]|nr:MAG: hypothetical protein CBARDCOR_2209 [uncultured Caballeronia sp.]